MATRQQYRPAQANTQHRASAQTKRQARRSSGSGRHWLIGLTFVVGLSLFAWYFAVSHDAGPAPLTGNTVVSY